MADALVHPRCPGRRVGIDGAQWIGVDLSGRLAEELRLRGRSALCVDVEDFLRPASLRLERGRDDPDSYYEDWYDDAAVRREVLEPLAPGGSGRWLPTLWDAAADRATRAEHVTAGPDDVLLLRGPFLFGRGFALDVTVHLALSPAARIRRVPRALAERDLPAYRRYDADMQPAEAADVVVRCDDTRHLAVVDRLTPRLAG